LVNHQGKVLVHHQFKGSVLVRFPDPPTSESGSAVHQGRKDLTRRGQELGHHHSKTPSYNKYGDEQSDHGHHPSKLRTLPMADNHPDNRDDNEDEVQPSEQSNDHMDDLQEENYRPGDRVKSRIQLWEAKVEGTNFAKEEDKRTNGKAGRQVNQVQPFSLRDGGQKHEFDHSQHDQDHRNHVHHHHENPNHQDHGNHYHENHDQRNHQHHNHQKYGHSVDQMQVHETNHQNYQVHLNHNQVTRSNTSHNDNDHEETYLPNYQNGRKENIQIQVGGTRTNGKTSKDEERERSWGRPKENLGEMTSEKDLPIMSKVKKNQLSGEIMFKEPQVPSETLDEAFQTKSESENKELKPQESTNLKEFNGYQWNSKFSGILGGQGGLGWVQGRLESALAQLGPDPVQTGLRKSLPENMCSLTDVPEDYINGLDLCQVKVAGGSRTPYRQLLERYSELEGPLLKNLCAARWKVQHLEAFAGGQKCRHYPLLSPAAHPLLSSARFDQS